MDAALGKFYVNYKGYPALSKSPHHFLHRATWERIAGKKLPEGWVVHHQNFNKLCWCGTNLVAMPAEFNPRPDWRHPYTGRLISAEEYKEVMGEQAQAREYDEMPDWVRAEA